MASKKDMRRPDLAIPYVEPPKERESDLSSTFSSTMPMMAMFTRNKMLGWVSFIMAMLNYLSETPAQKETSATPGYVNVGMAFMAVLITYLPLFLPPTPGQQPMAGTGTGAPAAAPP